MSHKRSRAAFIRLIATVGGCAAAATIAAAGAPSARADDPLSDIMTAVKDVLAAGQTDFALAGSDFAEGSTGESAGLTALFEGLDDDLAVPSVIYVGTLDALTNPPVVPPTDFEFVFATPSSSADAVTEAQSYYAEAVALDDTIASLPVTDYSTIALDNFDAQFLTYIAAEVELIGLF
jgi:hypothetical protein